MQMTSRSPFLVNLGVLLLAGAAHADLFPQWTKGVSTGFSHAGGLKGLVVDDDGVVYITGLTGPSFNTDVQTAAIGTNGEVVWSTVFNGAADWNEQVRGIALGPDGSVWVTGNTPSLTFFQNVMLLKYDRATGALLNTVQYSSGTSVQEYGASVATDALGNAFVGGATALTTSDGGDAQVIKFDASGAFQWKSTWDGSAAAPVSTDRVLKLAVDPAGDVLALIQGVASPSEPEIVVVKYAGADGAELWAATFSGPGNDVAVDLDVDQAGDAYVTSTAFDAAGDRYSTLKFSGIDGFIVWQEYDAVPVDSAARGLDVDDQGGVYVTGVVDLDGIQGNGDDDTLTVKRSAADGAFLWSHQYGSPCLGCIDTATDVLVDSAGHAFVAGFSSSPPYTLDQLTLVLDASTGAELDREIVTGTETWSTLTGILAFDAAENLFFGCNVQKASTEMSITKHTTLAAPLYELQVTQLVTGQPATFTLEDAVPAAAEFVIFGASGPTSVPLPALGVTIAVANPFLLFSGISDGSGVLAKTFTVPAGIGGVTIWFQGLEIGSDTPLVVRTVQ